MQNTKGIKKTLVRNEGIDDYHDASRGEVNVGVVVSTGQNANNSHFDNSELDRDHDNSAQGSKGQVEPGVDVMEDQWVLQNTGTPEEVEIEESPGTEHTESYVVDLTEHFNRIFAQTTFNSFQEFEELFNQFKRETGSVFRIKSSCSVTYENSRRKKHFIPARFKFVSVKYCCVHYGQPKIAGQGIRTKQRYLPCGCECVLSVSYNRGALVISQATMQHNHEVSNEMAPYYAINRRISNSELKQVADVIELMPSSRALQQFLQEHFHRPTTLQDAKNIRARLKALHTRQTTNLSAVRSIKSDPIMQAEEEEDDSDERGRIEVEDMGEDIVMEDYQDEKLFSQQEEQQKSQQQQDQRPSPQPRWKEKVINEIKAKLSDLMHSCDTSIFWERISVINKVIECWENGDNFDVHYASENDLNSEEGLFVKKEPDLNQRNGGRSSLHQRRGALQGRSKKIQAVNASTSLGSSSDSHMKFMLPVLSGSDMQFLPASLKGESLKLMLPHKENNAQGKSPNIQKRRPGRPRKNPVRYLEQRHVGLDELSPQTFQTKINSFKSYATAVNNTRVGTVEQKSIKSNVSHVKQPIVMSVTRGNSVDMCDQAMEVEIEVDGDMVNVKQVKLEPLEYHEVDVTDNILHQLGEHSYI
ncbi:uncharacterized protein [Panulirus ornatus]|uniref:uncharacterized protein n=1 Tax=Panulirus ornatus TaxID=150431 RepID=UPI003A8C795B